MKTLKKQFLTVSIALILFSLGTQTGLALGDNCYGFPVLHKVVENDTVSKLALATYQSQDLNWDVDHDTLMKGVDLIARASRLENPDLIIANRDVLTIPCLWSEKKAAKEFKPTVEQEIRKEIAPTLVSSEFPNLVLQRSEPAYVVDPMLVASVQLSELASLQEPVLDAVATWPGENIPENSPKVSLVKTPTPKTPKVKMNYQVVVHIPEGAMEGMREGTFPAQLVENQDKRGEWRSRQNMTVSVRKIENIYDCFIILAKKPTKNTSIAIDFGNRAKPVQITSYFLLNGEEMRVSVPKKMRRKAYKTLNAFFPKKPGVLTSVVWRPVRPFIPLASQAGAAFFTGNYIGLAYMASSFARGKMEKSLQPKPKVQEELPSHVQYALSSEADNISQLAQEVESLKVKLNFMLRQQEDLKLIVPSVSEGQGGKK